MEPQCFDQTLAESQKCGSPPALINGYVLVNLNQLGSVEQIMQTFLPLYYMVYPSETWSGWLVFCTHPYSTPDTCNEDQDTRGCRLANLKINRSQARVAGNERGAMKVKHVLPNSSEGHVLLIF